MGDQIGGIGSSILLTDGECRAMDTTAQLAGELNDIVGDGRSREGDMAELIGHLHAIQRAIMSQAAGRAYPNRFRLLGSEIAQDNDDE